MASSSDQHAKFEKFVGSLNEEQLHLFEKLGIRDVILHPPVSADDRGQRHVETRLRMLEESQRNFHMNNRNSPLAPAKTSHQQSYEIKFGLRNDAGGVIDRLTNAEIVSLIRQHKAPFDQVQACRVHATALVLMVSNPEAEAALHAHQHEIGPMLGVAKDDCYLLRPTYQVQIYNFNFRQDGEFKCPEKFIKDWSTRNKVHITGARWTYKKLVWTLDRLGDAQKLVKDGTVWLSGYQATAAAFDKRSTPKQCHACGKPGHLKTQCPDRSKPFCLRCGKQTKEHNAWDGRCKGPECCVNCGRNHAAWSPLCQDPRMRRAREESRTYAAKQVFWQRFPALNSDPTTNTWLKAGESDARKRHHADVEEHSTFGAAAPVDLDIEMHDCPPVLESQELSLSPGTSALPISPESSTQLRPPMPIVDAMTRSPPPQTPSDPYAHNPFPSHVMNPTSRSPTPRFQQPNEFSDRQMGPIPRIIPETSKAPLAPLKLAQSDSASEARLKTTRIRSLGGNNGRRRKEEKPKEVHSSFRAFYRQTRDSDSD